MSWQSSPPSTFPEPFQIAASRSANRTQNPAGDTAYLQAGPPPGHAHPSQRHSPNIHPQQLYPESSSHLSAPRRFTDPTATTYEHASFSHPSAPAPLLGVSVRYASNNSSGPPPRAVTMPMPIPVHSNAAPSTTHSISPPNIMHPPSHLEMSRGLQPSQGLSYRDDSSSDFSGRGYSHSPEDTSTLSKAPLSLPFAQKKRPGKHPDKGSGRGSGKGSSSGLLDQRPCTFCGTLSPREVIDRLGGFCSERHRREANRRLCKLCGTSNLPEVIEHWGGFCSERHRWKANKRPCTLCGTFCPWEIIESWGGFCTERHRRQWEANIRLCKLCGTSNLPEVIEHWGGFCSERHRWEANQCPCTLCGTFCPREVIESWGGFCTESHRLQWEAHQQGR